MRPPADDVDVVLAFTAVLEPLTDLTSYHIEHGGLDELTWDAVPGRLRGTTTTDEYAALTAEVGSPTFVLQATPVSLNPPN